MDHNVVGYDSLNKKQKMSWKNMVTPGFLKDIPDLQRCQKGFFKGIS